MMVKSYKEKVRAQREQDILNTASHMIMDVGYSNLSMDSLAEAVGISKPTLYQHFKSKEEMAVKAMIQGSEQMEAFMVNLEGGSPLERLEKFMRFMAEQHVAPDGFKMAGMGPEIGDMLAQNMEFMGIQQRVGGMLYSLIQEARMQGEIADDIKPQVVLGAMFAMMNVVNPPHWVRYRSSDSHELIEETIRLFIRGIRPANHAG
jgi:AcrR family transcriptional regulator